jgi:hypothetical protein
MSNTIKELAETLSAAPAAYAVIPIPKLPCLAEDFFLPTSVDPKYLQAAISSGLQIVLAPMVDPNNQNPDASGLSPFAIRAEIFFKGPESDGKCAVVFDTGRQVAVRYTETDGNIRATSRKDDLWKI